MVRKKKKPGSSTTMKVKVKERELHSQKVGEEEENQDYLCEILSSLSIKANGGYSNKNGDIASTSSSSDICFDSNSNGDDNPSTSTTSSSTSSSELFWDSDLIQIRCNAVVGVGNKGFGSGVGGMGGNKQKKVVASMGTVANVIGKGYATHSPSSGGGGKRNYCMKAKGLYNNKAASNEEAVQFLCSMLGEDCELNLGVVKDVLCQCGYDVDKALDVLLDLSASSQNKEGCTGVYNQKFQDCGSFTEFDYSEDDVRATCQFPHRMSGSTFDLSEKEIQQILQSSDYDYRNYAEVLVGPKKQTRPAITERNLPQKVLESLFKVPKNPTEEPDSMDWKNVVKKMESIGQVLDSSADSVAKLQQNANYAKGEDYKLCRKSATQHYDAMKSCYQKAANAYSRGQRSYASYLSEQGKVHNKIAREADVKASQEIFESRNKGIQNTVTIDLHGQHVKQAIKLLKVHLFLFTTYVPCKHLVQILSYLFTLPCKVTSVVFLFSLLQLFNFSGLSPDVELMVLGKAN
ncbi:hypothetical protein AQUCO_04500083v1 [Aquilegia coerulea]|uniref:DUF1771 domain-containing protein n=1 Tax=Aquilegia coerulea TaxID=218851 RepID=A0A2G5CN15_AQUCA|nr:hypothetical protein AQUCO_04500083v1 [Aquilegia coerulea]